LFGINASFEVITAKGKQLQLAPRQDGHNLIIGKFRCFHAKSPTYTLRENPTFTSFYF